MEQIISALLDMGLTEYEAKVYASLLNMGKSTASQVALESKVPRARIYDVLSTLARKGWVTIINEKPLKYVSSPLSEIKNKLKKIEGRFKKAEKKIVDELHSNIKNENEAVSEASIDILLGRKETFRRIAAAIESSRDSIYLYYCKEELLLELLPYLKKAAEKGVKVRMLVLKDCSLKTKRKLKKYFEVRVQPSFPGHACLLVDSAKYMNIFFRNNDLNADVINYKKCIYCLLAWLSREWEEAKPLK